MVSMGFYVFYWFSTEMLNRRCVTYRISNARYPRFPCLSQARLTYVKRVYAIWAKYDKYDSPASNVVV